jgi:hypothetical protein
MSSVCIGTELFAVKMRSRVNYDIWKPGGGGVFLAALLTVQWVCCLGQVPGSKPKNGGKMDTEVQRKAVELLTFKDAEYFDFDDDRTLDVQSKLAAMFREIKVTSERRGISTGSPSGLAIGAPATVDLGRQDGAIPLLVGTRQTGLREWEVEYDQNLRIIISDLSTGKVLMGMPSIMGKREETPEPSMTGAPPNEINAASVVTSVRKFDLGHLFETEWRPTRLAVTAIVFDWVSNTRVVTLKGGELAAEQISPQHPSNFLSSTVAGKATPRITRAEHAALAIPNTIQRNGPIPVHAAISIPRGRAAVARSAEPGDAPLLLASLLLVKRDDRRPLKINLAVPATIHSGPARSFLKGFGRSREGGSATPETVEAYFSLDVRTASTEPIQPGTYQVYLVVGDTVSGPYEVTVGAP